MEGVTGQYRLEREGRTLETGELIDLWERWVATLKVRMLSTWEPKNSTRAGASAWGAKMSTMPPRRAA